MKITQMKLIEPFALCYFEPPFPLKCKLFHLLLFAYSIKITRFLCQKDDIHGIMMMTCWIKYWEADLFFSRDYCWRFWSSEIFYMPRAEFEQEQKLSSGSFDWNYAVSMTTTPRWHCIKEQKKVTRDTFENSCIFSLMIVWADFIFDKWLIILVPLGL